MSITKTKDRSTLRSRAEKSGLGVMVIGSTLAVASCPANVRLPAHASPGISSHMPGLGGAIRNNRLKS